MACLGKKEYIGMTKVQDLWQEKTAFITVYEE